MCGLFGMAVPQASGFNNKDMETLISNMNINMFRGSDSTGMVCANIKGDFNFVKSVGGPGSFCENPKWAPFKAGIFKDGKIVMGHGRSATRGKVTLKNAHPFQVFKNPVVHAEGHIILAHNGTLTPHQQMPGFDQHDVDSEWLAKKIVELGPMEALGRVYGAVATTWYDPNERALFFYRNNERPLHFVRSKNEDLIWNSELCALMWLKYRYGLEYEAVDVVQFKPNFLYKLNVEKTGEFEEVKEVPRLYPTHVPMQHQNWRGRFDEDEGGDSWVGWGYPSGGRNIRTDLTRGYEEDIRHVFNRTMTSVEWADNKRITRYGTKENGYTSTEVQPPYLPGLQSIIFDEAQGDVVVTKNGHEFHVQPAPSAKVLPIEINGRYRRRGNSGYDFAAPVPQGLLKGAKFSFMVDGIKHKCRLDKDSLYSLASYSNAVDGHFAIGQTIFLESIPGDSERIGFESYRVTGTRLKSIDEKQSIIDECIEWYYFSPGAKGQQVGIFSAKIQLLSFTDKDEFNISGCYVKALLTDVVKLEELGETARGPVIYDGKAGVVVIENEVQ